MHRTILLLALTGMAAPAAAGSVFEMSEIGGADVAQTISVQKGKLRAEVAPTANSPTSTMIFADDELLILNDEERSYYRITPESLEELSATLGQASEELDAAMEQMQAELANLPPEQREMAERMMRSRMPNMSAMTQAAPTVRIERRAADTVNGYACTEHAVYVNDTLTQVLCAADYSTVPGAEGVAAAMEDMQGFLERLRGAMPPALANLRSNPFDGMSRIEGFPVRTRTYVNDRVLQELVLSSAETRDIAEDRFEVPAGYAEQSLTPEGSAFH